MLWLTSVFPWRQVLCEIIPHVLLLFHLQACGLFGLVCSKPRDSDGGAGATDWCAHNVGTVMQVREQDCVSYLSSLISAGRCLFLFSRLFSARRRVFLFSRACSQAHLSLQPVSHQTSCGLQSVLFRKMLSRLMYLWKNQD